MVPADKEELRKLVTDATMETYEDLSYQLIKSNMIQNSLNTRKTMR